MFDYLKSYKVNTYTDHDHGGSYTVKAVAKRETPTPAPEPESPAPGQRDIEEMIRVVVTNALEAQSAKRTRSGDFKPTEASADATFLNGAPVQVLKNPKPSLSNQKAPGVAKGPAQSQARDGEAAKKGTVAYINEAVRKTLGVKPALTLKDLIHVSPIYAKYLVAEERKFL